MSAYKKRTGAWEKALRLHLPSASSITSSNSNILNFEWSVNGEDRTAAESAGVETEEDNLSGHKKQGRGQGSVKGTIPNTAYQGGSLWSHTIPES